MFISPNDFFKHQERYTNCVQKVSYEKEELVGKRSNQGEKQRLRDAEKESQQEGGMRKTKLVLEKELIT